MNATFYGEVLTTVYFFVMQPIGLYAWLSNRINDQGKVEESHFEAKKLSVLDWLKYLVLTAIIWIGMGLAYQSIHSARPFRDSVTDATNGVGQLLMTRLYQVSNGFSGLQPISLVSTSGGVKISIFKECTGFTHSIV